MLETVGFLFLDSNYGSIIAGPTPAFLGLPVNVPDVVLGEEDGDNTGKSFLEINIGLSVVDARGVVVELVLHAVLARDRCRGVIGEYIRAGQIYQLVVDETAHLMDGLVDTGPCLTVEAEKDGSSQLQV